MKYLLSLSIFVLALTSCGESDCACGKTGQECVCSRECSHSENCGDTTKHNSHSGDSTKTIKCCKSH